MMRRVTRSWAMRIRHIDAWKSPASWYSRASPTRSRRLASTSSSGPSAPPGPAPRTLASAMPITTRARLSAHIASMA